MVDVRLQLSGDSAQELLPELRSWFSREDELRGRVSAEKPTVSPGQMGGLSEVLIVALGAQGMGTALAASLTAWIRHRRPAVDIKVTGADGRQVKIATRDADIDVERLIREVAGDLPMRLPDPGKSRALLLGCGTYIDPSLPTLPAVKANLAGMKDALTSPEGTGLASEHCVALPEAELTPAEIGSHLTTLAAEAEDMLLVYYAGHGLIGPNDNLFLALPDTRGDRDLVSWTALPFQLLREALTHAPARNRIIILDCCFSGLAIDAMSSVSSAVSLQLKVAGTCTLASSPANRTSSAPPGEQYTAYTGELLGLLSNGAADQPELLTLTAIHDHLSRALPARGLPAPAQRNTETIGQLALARNKLWSPDSPHVSNPSLPVDDLELPLDLLAPSLARRRRRRIRLLAGTVVIAAAVAAALATVIWPDGTDPHHAVAATIRVGEQPQALALGTVTNDKGLYVANSGDDTVSVIDTATNKIGTDVLGNTNTVGVGADPTAVAVSGDLDDALTANANGDSVSLLNPEAMDPAWIKNVATGKAPGAVAIDSDASTAYVANANSRSVSVISLSTSPLDARVTGTILVGKTPDAIAIDPIAHTAYVANGGDDTVSEINTKTGKVTATVRVGRGPDSIAIDPAAHLAYVANSDGHTISVVDTSGPGKVTATIKVGDVPESIAVDPTFHTAYVAEQTRGRPSNSVSVIDTETNQVTGTVTVGSDPKAVAVDPDTHAAYVANSGSDTVSVIKPKGTNASS